MRIARFHNAMGPLGTYDGGREKAPAAACRKVALAKDGEDIPVWGDGKATRSFMYIDDCVEGIRRIMESSCVAPLNLGSTQLVTVTQLYETTLRVAGKKCQLVYDPSQPQGVRGRNSDNTQLKAVTGWEPGVKLEEGIAKLYPWVLEQVQQSR